MLKHRLLYGTLMIVSFLGIVLLDGRLDGSLWASATDKPLLGTLFCVLIALLMIPAQLELSTLASAKGLHVLTPISTLSSIVLATSWYWAQLIDLNLVHLALAIVVSLFAMFQYQHLKYGTSGTFGNCGASCLAVCYLGLLGGFALAIRVRFGVWPLLMYVFVVKFSDIGAYAIGKLCGKHKFSPRVSPGKTWEGMGGAAAAAAITAVLFGRLCGIMSISLALAFGVCFAFVGQMGDLVESMLKRDAEQKDSASKVPGFGGVLDIIDSPLAVAPFAYLFFACSL